MNPEIVSLGEPLLEFNSIDPGPLKNARQYEVGWGGDTSNFVIATSRLGGKAGYIGRLGSDDFGHIILDLWHKEGVDTRFVILDQENYPTGIYFISRQGEEHSFTYYRKDSAASRISPKDVPREYIANAKIFHASGISQAISNSACDAVFYAIDIAREAGSLVSYDPNLRPVLWGERRARAIVLETVGLADFVFPSMEDSVFLTGSKEPEEIANRLLKLGPKVVVIKLGNQGALLATGDQLEPIHPIKVNVVDTTGAGDVFDAAFLTAHLRGCPLNECTRFANAAAALTTTGWGAVKPIPYKGDVDALLRGTDGLS
jgi:2-dehydro-3-deoxygluconokinase